MGQLQKTLDLILQDGSRTSAVVNIQEVLAGGTVWHRITLSSATFTISEESELGFFPAMIKVRLSLERRGALLHCFGASEDVYPSGMQFSMGGGMFAYRNTLGQRSSRDDVVDIFETDASVRPSTVEQQRLFHEKWVESIS
jgi:hypothetical protein